jgi:hypothetical protein
MTHVQKSTLVVVTRNGMGHAAPDLQQKLIGSWLGLVAENGMLPGAVALYSEGVKLAARGSPHLDALRALEEQGVHLILCKTCIDYYGLEDQIEVGIVGGMGDILAAQWKAGKVISL